MAQQLTSITTFVLNGEKERSKINFDTTLTDAIDEVFTSLGENVKQAIYSYLENKHCIRKEQIPRMIESFAIAIETIFGEAAKLLELKIIEKIQNKVKSFAYKSKSKEVFFVEYLVAVQRHLDWQYIVAHV